MSEWLDDIMSRDIPKYVNKGGELKVEDGTMVSESTKRSRKQKMIESTNYQGTAEHYLQHFVFCDGFTPEDLVKAKATSDDVAKDIRISLGDSLYALQKIAERREPPKTTEEAWSRCCEGFKATMGELPEDRALVFTQPADHIKKINNDIRLRFIEVFSDYVKDQTAIDAVKECLYTMPEDKRIIEFESDHICIFNEQGLEFKIVYHATDGCRVEWVTKDEGAGVGAFAKKEPLEPVVKDEAIALTQDPLVLVRKPSKAMEKKRAKARAKAKLALAQTTK
tara:strand:- start:8908 stop:9747 length:840 start_codon:yes stop_codon:yes gene_type:complete